MAISLKVVFVSLALLWVAEKGLCTSLSPSTKCCACPSSEPERTPTPEPEKKPKAEPEKHPKGEPESEPEVMYAMFGVMLGIAVMTTILFGYLWYKTKKQLKLVNSGSDIAVNEKPPPYEKA